MWELLVVGVVVWLMIVAFGAALCRMAAIGDADMESSLRDLSYRPAWQSWQSERTRPSPRRARAPMTKSRGGYVERSTVHDST